MTSDKPGPVRADTRERILDEHRRIRALAEKLASSCDLAEIGAGLQELQPLFRRHFEREESDGGLHGGIRDQAPRHAGAVETLRDDHRRLLAAAAELDARVRACLDGPVAEIRRACDDLVRDLRAHEERENDVFIDAIWTDVGQGD